jgi:hypothetical protein
VSFDYIAKLTSVYNVLADANTTTAAVDLSEGLTERIKNIVKDDPRVRSAKDNEHPFVWVWLEDTSQEFAEIGPDSQGRVTKRKKVNYRILATIHKPGMIATSAQGLDEVYQLADNIENVFQKEYDLSGTALWCNPAATEFLGPLDMGGSYIKGVTIRLETEYLWR